MMSSRTAPDAPFSMISRLSSPSRSRTTEARRPPSLELNLADVKRLYHGSVQYQRYDCAAVHACAAAIEAEYERHALAIDAEVHGHDAANEAPGPVCARLR